MNKSVPAISKYIDMMGMAALMVAAVCLLIALNVDELALQGLRLEQFAMGIKAAIAFFASARVFEIGINVTAPAKRRSEASVAH